MSQSGDSVRLGGASSAGLAFFHTPPTTSEAKVFRRRHVIACLAIGVLIGAPAGSVFADPNDTPALEHVSNMGLCSAFLAQIGVRAEVNHLLKEIGPVLPDGPYNSPGELYRIRAQQHPNASAAQECVQR
jgi:hypothetical protein